MYNFDPYNVLLAIATNIPVLLMTAFVLQTHTYIYIYIFACNKLAYKQKIDFYIFCECYKVVHIPRYANYDYNVF